MIKIKDFLLELKKDGVVLMAGEKGIDRFIDYLTIQEFPFKSSRIHKNGFIMTTFYGFKNIDEIIQHLGWYVRTGISGIGFHGAIIPEIPKELTIFLDESKIPLFHIPKDLPYHIIYEKYHELIYKETANIKNNIDNLNQEMLDALVLEKDIHFVIQSIGKYLSVPIIYINKDMEILSLWNASPFSRSDLHNWLNALLKYYKNLFETTRIQNTIIEEKHLHKISQPNSVLIVPLSNKFSFYGYLLILNQKRTVPFQDSILKNVVTAIILDAIKKKQTIEYQKNKDAKQFEEVFLQKRTEPLHAEDFYFDINKIHSLLIAEPEYTKNIMETFHKLKNLIEETDRNALVWIMDKKIIALLQNEFPHHSSVELNIKVGISSKIKKVTNEEILMLYQQAKIALHFSYIEKKSYCRWKDLALKKLLHFMRDSSLLKDFYALHLQDLIYYDQQNNADLVKTLYIFLKTFFSLKESGDQLHIHPNTVKYRLKKIQEILPIDFHDSDAYMILMISLKSYFYHLECESLETMKTI